MSLITYQDIAINGSQGFRIQELTIQQKVFEHAQAYIKLLIDNEAGMSLVEHITENELTIIEALGRRIFAGTPTDVKLSHKDGDTILKLELISTTKLLDCTYKKRSFQSTGIPYATLMQEVVGGAGTVYVNGISNVTEGILVQYQETDWAFVRRLATRCGTFVSADVRASKPSIYVGVAPNTNHDVPQAGSMRDGEVITEVNSRLIRGILITTVKTTPIDLVLSQAPLMYSTNPVVGKIFAGTVMAVNADSVQVHITDIDGSFEAGNWWFSYSTIYSSPSNGAGIYSMPKVGETVRVFFPTDDPSEAFAAGSLNARESGTSSKEKVYTSPEGMGVKYYEGGLTIYTKDKSVSIDLSADGTMEIRANQSIDIACMENVVFSSGDKLSITAGKEVFLGAANSFIDLNAQGDGTQDIYSQKIFVL